MGGMDHSKMEGMDKPEAGGMDGGKKGCCCCDDKGVKKDGAAAKSADPAHSH